MAAPRMLASLSRAQLAFRGRPPSAPLDLAIAPHAAGGGGHAMLGQNGCGKTLASLALMGEVGGASAPDSSSARRLLHGGTMTPCQAVARVSFESHKQLLAGGGTVYRSLGALGPAARYLIVRFGLHPILFRPVSSISSGEIKKVLLVRALASRPELLLLDNAFDGLDVQSRDALKDLVSQTLRGFSQILVQGVDASAAARTQILLLTHRREEMVPELSTVSVFGPDGRLATAEREEGRLQGVLGGGGEGAGARLVRPPERELADVWPSQSAIDDVVVADGLRLSRGKSEVGAPAELATQLRTLDTPLPAPVFGTAERAPLPRCAPAERTHAMHGSLSCHTARVCSELGLVAAASGRIRLCASPLRAHLRRWTHAILLLACQVLRPLEWRVKPGEHWLVAGGNGAGKSSLARLLAAGGAEGEASERGGVVEGTLRILGRTAVGAGAADRGGVGWVSTERHLREAGRRDSAGAVLHERAHSHALGAAVCRWLRIEALLSRPFSELSQGEQKMVLIAAALAEGPRVLVVDEPCTSLDAGNRARVLGLFEALGCAQLTSLIYITHHPEEVLPCISHVLHLQGGAVAYSGRVEAYRPPAARP